MAKMDRVRYSTGICGAAAGLSWAVSGLRCTRVLLVEGTEWDGVEHVPHGPGEAAGGGGNGGLGKGRGGPSTGGNGGVPPPRFAVRHLADHLRSRSWAHTRDLGKHSHAVPPEGAGGGGGARKNAPRFWSVLGSGTVHIYVNKLEVLLLIN